MAVSKSEVGNLSQSESVAITAMEELIDEKLRREYLKGNTIKVGLQETIILASRMGRSTGNEVSPRMALTLVKKYQEAGWEASISGDILYLK